MTNAFATLSLFSSAYHNIIAAACVIFRLLFCVTLCWRSFVAFKKFSRHFVCSQSYHILGFWGNYVWLSGTGQQYHRRIVYYALRSNPKSSPCIKRDIESWAVGCCFIRITHLHTRCLQHWQP